MILRTILAFIKGLRFRSAVPRNTGILTRKQKADQITEETQEMEYPIIIILFL